MYVPESLAEKELTAVGTSRNGRPGPAGKTCMGIRRTGKRFRALRNVPPTHTPLSSFISRANVLWNFCPVFIGDSRVSVPLIPWLSVFLFLIRVHRGSARGRHRPRGKTYRVLRPRAGGCRNDRKSPFRASPKNSTKVGGKEKKTVVRRVEIAKTELNSKGHRVIVRKQEGYRIEQKGCAAHVTAIPRLALLSTVRREIRTPVPLFYSNLSGRTSTELVSRR